MKKLLMVLLLSAAGAFAAKGDVTKDGIVDINDCKAIAAAVASGQSASIPFSDGDIDGDGKVTIIDAMRLHQYLGGAWQDPTQTLSPTPEISEAERSFLAEYETKCDNFSSMTPAGFISLFPLLPRFSGKIPLTKYEYFDTVKALYLSDEQKTALELNGFVVRKPKYSSQSFISIYADVFKHDLPVLVTTDAMLDPLYRGYDDILKTLEKKRSIPAIDSVINAAIVQLPLLKKQISSATTSWLTNFEDVEVYLKVAQALLKGASNITAPSTSTVSTTAQLLLAFVAQEKLTTISLFGNTTSGTIPYTIDFSQFKPRGHYEYVANSSDSSLCRYFKCMMWLGRADCAFNLDSLRNVRDFVLLHACIEQGGVLTTLSNFNNVISYFVGDMDKFSIESMTRFWSDYTPRPTLSKILLDSATAKTIRSALQKKDYGNQFILSQALCKDPSDFRPAFPKIAQLSGQRFILDSYLLGHTVEAYVKERNKPMLEEVAFCLGNNAGLSVVKNDVTTFTASVGDYKPLHARLGAGRALFDAYPYWNKNLYTLWLDALRELSTTLPPSTPSLMRTSQWQDKQMNAQLTSWAQLRHNTLLYAKQSYSAMTTCKYPKGYVEPYPAFYRKIGALIAGLSRFFDGNPTYQNFFSNWASTTDTLAQIAENERSGTTLTAQQMSFLNKMVYDIPERMCGGPSYIGWYPQLYFSLDGEGAKPSIADVHTIPPSEISPSNMVVHAATGCAQTMIMQLAVDDTCGTLYVGGVGSFYEQDVSPIARLSDSDWSTTYTNSISSNTPVSQPAWFEQYRK